MELAANNAALVLSKDRERLKREEGRTIGAVREIEKLIGISDIRRMEAYDISNTNGFESVGSMVVYERGKPKRNDYRKFKIKGIEGADDYGSMREVLTRRFTHGLKEQKESKEIGGFSSFPDLILMDGGKGQVNVALQVLGDLRLNIPVLSLIHIWTVSFQKRVEGIIVTANDLLAGCFTAYSIVTDTVSSHIYTHIGWRFVWALSVNLFKNRV